MAKVMNSLDRRLRRNGEKERVWRKLVDQQKRGGGTVRAFCRERALNENSFYHWRREIRLRDREADTKHATSAAKPALAPVVVVDDPLDIPPPNSRTATTIEISLGDGTTVRVPPGSTREQLAAVFAVLEPARC